MRKILIINLILIISFSFNWELNVSTGKISNLEWMSSSSLVENDCGARTTENDDFALIVIGTLSSVRYFGPPPIPPNYTTVNSITWDLPGSYGLIFRLNYYGSSPIEIVQLLFWQEATEFGITWNVTSPTPIPLPEKRWVKYSWYEFAVEGLFIAETIIFVQITLESQQKVLISIPTPWNISYLPSWPSSSRISLGNLIDYLVFFTVSSGVLLLHRQRKRRNA